MKWIIKANHYYRLLLFFGQFNPQPQPCSPNIEKIRENMFSIRSVEYTIRCVSIRFVSIRCVSIRFVKYTFRGYTFCEYTSCKCIAALITYILIVCCGIFRKEINMLQVLVYNSGLINGFNNCTFWSIIVVITILLRSIQLTHLQCYWGSTV
jgi:hypothetical protein